jgi:sigma-B regulation protein RsbU (phosphoserine phosphatase)
LLLVDDEAGCVRYAGAGDLPPLHYRPLQAGLNQIKTGGLLLGLFYEAEYEEHVVEMAAGEQLLVFSDGIIDYTENNEKKSDYGLFATNAGALLQAGGGFVAVRGYLERQLGGGRQADDCSIISIQKNNRV